jgi:hypothetical protein
MSSQNQREQVKRRVGVYRERLAEIRADKSLSPLGKRRAIADLYQATRSVVDPLRKEIAELDTTSVRGLEQRLFGMPSGADPAVVIAYRDAQDRVSAVRRPEELGELMERAASSGDETLLQAGAAHAWRRSREPLASDYWAPLVDEYMNQNPALQRDYEAFVDANTAFGPTRRLVENMEMSLGGEPAELRQSEAHLSDDAPKSDVSSGLWR